MASPFGRLRTLRHAAYGAASVVLIGAGAFLMATPALAAQTAPWWHLSSGSRPSYIDPAHGHPATGEPEVQVITVPTATFEGEPEQADMTLGVGGTLLEQFCTEYLNNEICGVTLLDAAGIQGVLEGPYGAGKVHVSESSAGGVFRFTIETKPGVEPVEAIEEFGISPDPTVEITDPGHEGSPAVPDGELYFTAANLGDASLSGKTSPVKLTDVLPAGLEAVAIDATRPDREGSFLQRLPIPCDLATLTCTLEANELGPAHTSLDALAPFDALSVRISVNVEPGAQSGELNEVEVSGGEGFSCADVGPGLGSYGDPGCTDEETLGNSFGRTYTGPVPATSISSPITISAEPVPFGVETYEHQNEEAGGAADLRAASHPFQQTTTIVLNQGPDTSPPGSGVVTETGAGERHVNPAALPKDLHFKWPPGLIGNPTGVATCTDAQFFISLGGTANACPASSAIGVATVLVNEPSTAGVAEIPVPLFNLVPHYGEPARFGFNVIIANAPVVIDVSLRSDGDYGATVETNNITQTAAFLSSEVAVWGAPGDPRHNLQRGWGCLLESRGFSLEGSGVTPCASTATSEGTGQTQPPFLFLPTSCAGPAPDTVFGDTWVNRLAPADFPLLATNTMPQLEACNQVPFAPQIHSEPTSNAATSPTGLGFDINVDDEGQRNPNGLIQSQIKKAVVTLPQGFTANPSVAEGLKACSEAEYRASSLQAGSGCSEESKVGDVEIESPLVKQKVLGSLFVAKQGENPNHNLLTLYLVAKNPELGVMVKQALKVTPNQLTGQLTTEADEIPQLPFSKFHLSFRSGQRSPLVTPPACGPYTVGADLYPYSNPGAALHRTSSFQITQGPEGNPCPSGGTPPFHPGLEAGTINNAAGTYSPFYTHITRRDSEQEITRFSIKLPPGVIGKLAGVGTCSDAQVAAAKAREHEGGGTEEQNSPSCPASSEVGHSLVGSGVGNVLAYAPGKLYLAGPYHGSNISLVSITAAKVGPFDLGTVVVRFALKIDPETAEVFVDGQGSDPIPHIVDGIPVHLRDIRAYVDRPNFTLNPTSCAKKSTASTILGSGLDFVSPADDNPVTVSSPFQAADCASLGFKPKLGLSLKGGTKRGATPAFKAVLTYPKGAYANIAKSVVTLPHSEFLEQAHIGTVCTRVQFKEGTTPGEKCPAASIYGKARAVTPLLDEPLEGPVYLRSSSHNLPDLVAALHNGQINIDLDGRIDSVKNGRIRNTFEAVPDAPVTKFVLEMKGGKKGLLVNSTNLCTRKNRAISEFTGQNGKIYNTNPVLSAQCNKKHKGGKKKGK